MAGDGYTLDESSVRTLAGLVRRVAVLEAERKPIRRKTGAIPYKQRWYRITARTAAATYTMRRQVWDATAGELVDVTDTYDPEYALDVTGIDYLGRDVPLTGVPDAVAAWRIWAADVWVVLIDLAGGDQTPSFGYGIPDEGVTDVPYSDTIDLIITNSAGVPIDADGAPAGEGNEVVRTFDCNATGTSLYTQFTADTIFRYLRYSDAGPGAIHGCIFSRTEGMAAHDTYLPADGYAIDAATTAPVAEAGTGLFSNAGHIYCEGYLFMGDDGVGNPTGWRPWIAIDPAIIAAAVGSHELLDGTVHTDTLAGTVVRGDLITGNATPAWSRLAKGTSQRMLTMNLAGTDLEWSHFVPVGTYTGSLAVWSVGDAQYGAIEAGTEGQVLTWAPGDALKMEWANPTGVAHALLSGIHSDTTTATVSVGSLILGGETWGELTIGADGYVLTSDGTTASWQPGGMPSGGAEGLVLGWNDDTPSVVDWVPGLPLDAVAGDIARFDGSGWIVVTHEPGALLRYDGGWGFISLGKGSMFVGNASINTDVLAVGTNGKVLVANSTETLGVKWDYVRAHA